MQKVQFSRRKKDWLAIGFLATMITVPLIHFCIFYIGVNAQSILLAFQKPTGGFTWYNFRTVWNSIFEKGSQINEAVINTFLFFLCGLLISFPISISTSYFLFKKIKGHRFFQMVFYLPGILGGVALTTLFKAFTGGGGPLWYLAQLMGKEWPEFFADSRYARWAIMAYGVWTGFGGNMVLYCGQMNRIPPELFECARLDGITDFKELTKIIMPLIWPTITMVLTFMVAGLFSSGGAVLLFTQGKYGTMTIAYWIFDQVYTYNSYNLASAAGLLFTLVGIPITFTFKWLIERRQEAVQY